MAIDVVDRFDRPISKFVDDNFHSSYEDLKGSTGNEAGGFGYSITTTGEVKPETGQETILYRSPRFDFYSPVRVFNAIPEKSAVPTGTDLKFFIRSGSTVNLDKNEIRHTLQADFEAGLKKEGLSVLSEGKIIAKNDFFDDFDDGDYVGWKTSITANGTIEISSGKWVSAPYSVVLTDPDADSTTCLFYDFETKSSGLLIFEIHCQLGGYAEGYFQLRGPGGEIGPYIAVKRNERLSYCEAGAWAATALTTVTGTWYKIRLEVNLDNQTYSLFVNDIERASNVGYYQASSSLSRILFAPSWKAGTGTLYVDDARLGDFSSTSIFESSIIDLGSSFEADMIAIHSDVPGTSTLTLQARSGSEAQAYDTGITGVTPKYTNPDHPVGTGTLRWDPNYSTLQWRDNSQPAPDFGDPVTIDVSGTYKIKDRAEPKNFIEVEVDKTALPPVPYIVEADYLTSEWKPLTPTYPTGLTGNRKITLINRTNPDSGLQLAKQSNRFWQYRIEGTTNGKETWKVRDVIFIPKPTNWDVLQETASVGNCETNRYFQWIILGSTDLLNTWEVYSFKVEARFFGVDLKGTYPDMGIGCTNLKSAKFSTGGPEIYSISYSAEETELTAATGWRDAKVALTVSFTPDKTEATISNDVFQARLLKANVIIEPASPSIAAIAKNDLNRGGGPGQRFQLLDENGYEIPIKGEGENKYYEDGTETAPIITDIRGDAAATGSGENEKGLKRTIKNLDPTTDLTNMQILIRRADGQPEKTAEYIKFLDTDNVAYARTISRDKYPPDSPLTLGLIPKYGGTKDFYLWVDAPEGAPVQPYKFIYEFYWVTGE
jgi:hypothetical protein